MARKGYQTIEKRERLYIPHLERWVHLGLIDRFERLDPESSWPKWRIHWSDGKISTWYDSAMKAAIVAVHHIEQLMAGASA